MTLVVCAYMDDKLSCLSDTRISSYGATISDSAAKLFTIPVTIKFIGTGDVAESTSYSLGFAFCGATLLASNTHAIASNCTQVLHTTVSGAFPSVLDVSKIYSKSAEYVMRDANIHTVTERLLFEGIIFGYCPVEKKYRLFHIFPKITSVEFAVELQELEMVIGSVYAIGSGRNEFLSLMETPNSCGNKRTVLDAFIQVMKENSIKDVGGYPQVLEAHRHGAGIVPVLTQDPSSLDNTIVTVNGFDTSSIDLPKHFGFGVEVFGLDVEKIVGRVALREAGIDPDGGQVSIGIQNHASISFAVKEVFKANEKLTMDNNFFLEKVIPISGSWYFYARCVSCRRKTPLFKDLSFGKSINLFTGGGKVYSHCFYCDAAVRAIAVSLKSYQWK